MTVLVNGNLLSVLEFNGDYFIVELPNGNEDILFKEEVEKCF